MAVYPVKFENYLHPQYEARRKLQRFANPASLTWNNTKRRRKESEMQLQGDLNTYCSISSIHGFSCICHSTSWQRGFWWFVIMLAVIITLYFFFLNVIDMHSQYTKTTYSCLQQPIHVTPFPIVTICPLNRISQANAHRFAHKIFANDTSTSPQELMQLFKLALWYTSLLPTADVAQLEKLQHILDENNMNLEDILRILQPSCSNIFNNCFWRGSRISCEKSFVEVNTMAGSCCQARISEYGREKGLEKNPEPATTLNKLALRFMLTTNRSDYAALIFPNADYIVSIHNSMDIFSLFEQSILLTASNLHIIKLEMSSRMADANLLQYPLHARHCQSKEDPNILKWYINDPYTRRKCTIDSWIDTWYKRCGCVQPFLPRPRNERICSLSKKDRDCFKDPMIQLEHIESTCLPSCDFIAVKSRSTSVKLNASFTYLGDFLNFNDSEDIAVTIKFKSLTMLHTYLSIYKTVTSLIASMGGLAGLQLGISAISVYEILFFVMLLPLIAKFLQIYRYLVTK